MPTLSPNRPAAGRWLIALAVACLSGCSATGTDGRLLGLITPYRADIVQGNVVTREQAASLKVGMSRDQVRQLLGAPMLVDAFHVQRWDYVFLIRRQGTEQQLRSLVVLFDGERVAKIESPELPTEYDFVSSISRKPVAEGAVKLALTPEERAALPLPPPRAAAEAVAAPQGAVRTYPPLETTP